MTSSIRKDVYTNYSDTDHAEKAEPSGPSHIYTEAYGSYLNTASQGDSSGHSSLPNLEFTGNSQQVKKNPATEGLDPMYYNFSVCALDPRGGIESTWFDKELNKKILTQMSDQPAHRDLPAEAFRDAEGNLSEAIDLRHGNSRLSASVSEGKQIDEAQLSLLFIKLRTSSEAKFDENVVEIANKLHVQGELFRVMELAQKIDDPQTRRGLQLAVLEESLHRNGSSYYKIALAQVFPSEPESAEAYKKRMDETYKRNREEKSRSHEAPPNRPGLSTEEEGELGQLCGNLWSKEQLLFNMSRAKFNWSH